MGASPKRRPRYRSHSIPCDVHVLLWHTTSIDCSMYDPKRSAARMRALRRALQSKEKQRGQALLAQKQARTLGVNMAFDNPWHIGKAEDWVFGPDPIEDNIYRCLPQVTLHGMDEGLTQKLNLVILTHAIAEVEGNKMIICNEHLK